MNHTADYTIEELMAVVISREVKNNETIGVGMESPIPAAGCLLAEQLHAPDANIILTGSKDYYPFPGGVSELHFLAQRGDLDLFFLSALQIDRKANFNLHIIGDYKSPSLRIPGAYGSAMLYYMAHRVIFFRTEHTRRTFVEKVDFITGAGITPENVYREGGPALVVTPMAVLSWERTKGEWMIESVHPNSTIEDVKDNTGFDLEESPLVKVTPVPAEEELHVLRTIVRDKLLHPYADFAIKKLLST